MAVIDLEATNLQRMVDCWFPADLNNWLNQLTKQERVDAEAWINTHVFDAALASRPPQMNVTAAIRTSVPSPPSWVGCALQPLYDRTGQDPERARLFYGNFVCSVGIGRPELWWRRKETVGQDQHSSTYILNSQISALAGTP